VDSILEEHDLDPARLIGPTHPRIAPKARATTTSAARPLTTESRIHRNIDRLRISRRAGERTQAQQIPIDVDDRGGRHVPDRVRVERHPEGKFLVAQSTGPRLTIDVVALVTDVHDAVAALTIDPAIVGFRIGRLTPLV